MAEARKDYTQCADEPIARLGNVQACGELLIVDRAGQKVLASSPGLWEALNISEPASDQVPAILADQLAHLLPGLSSQVEALDTKDWPGLECIGHANPDGYVIEWLRLTEPSPVDVTSTLDRLKTDLKVASETLFAGAQRLAEGVAKISGYDRVMVYRFHPDWSGEIIAEVRRPELTPFLGLRYPESDIPSQARELYLHNTLRIVADVDDVILPLRYIGDPPDLSMAVLRSSSPTHLQYMRTMRVRSTLTVSLLHQGRLWGLILCHHRSPRLPPALVRRALNEVASVFTTVLAQADMVNTRRSGEVHAVLRKYIEESGTAILKNLLLRHDGLVAMIGADGIAWVDEARVLAVGLAPNATTLRQLAAGNSAPGSITVVERLSLFEPEDPRRTQPAGMLAAKLTQGWLALFRRELVQEIHWAGNPEEAVEHTTGGAPSPRRSFALWRQIITGACRPWTESDQALLAAAIHAIAIAGPAEALAEDACAAAQVLVDEDQAVLHSLTELMMPNATALMLTGAGEDARVLHVTPALAQLLGVSPIALLGRTWHDAALMLGFAPRAAVPGSADDPTIVPAFSPEHGPLLLRLRLEMVMQIAKGEAVQRYDALLIDDDTRSERLGMALRSAVLQTEQARRGRDAFLRNSSHELRTPLNAIIGFAELLEDPERSFSAEIVREYGQHISNAGRILLELIEHLLQVSQIEVRRVVAHWQVFDLGRLLHEQASLLSPLFAKKHVRLEMSVAESINWVGDPGLIRQAVVNLLANALKFTPTNGWVTCSLTVSERMAEIVIADTGPGIDPANQARIFEAFEQADTSLTRQHGGAGLGLFIARNFIEALKGKLMLTSTSAAGSRFVIRLPVSRLN